MTHANTNPALTLDAAPVSQLHAHVRGPILTPADAEYDAARTVFYGGFDRRPALIVRAADAADVAQVVLFARETGAELAVRGGGHSMAGHSTTEGGILLDLSQMKKLEIDPEQRTAWAEAGLTAGEYTHAAGAYGLATGFGDNGGVGIGGITLGGGIGYLTRKYGLTIDALLAAEIVTADGQILQIDEDHHPDLFWAIRGGGGNFGVVTRFKFRLYEVGTVVGGMMILPATPALVRDFIAHAQAAPEELSIISAVMIAPPMPFIPADHHGKPAIMAFMVYTGDVEAGERAIAPFRALASPITDTVKAIPYPEMYPPEEEYHPTAVARVMFLDEIGQREIDTIFQHLQAATANMAVAQIRVLGGAVARVPAEATAYAHRERQMMVTVAAMYEDPDEAPSHEAWVSSFATALRQDSTGAYVNFLGSEGESRVHEAYPGATWERLAAIKTRYDPTNLFRRNQNLPPATS